MITRNSEGTIKLGEKIAKELLKARDSEAKVVVLYGDLGSGKTTFVKGLARGLGIKRRVISPTFIIAREYQLRSPKSFYHVDLYRISGKKDIEQLGLEELMSKASNIIAIEWGEKMGSLLPARRWDIKFEYVSKSQRKITVWKI